MRRSPHDARPLPVAAAAPRASVAPARACAYAVLRRVFEHGAYADKALQAQARGLAPRDRALAKRLAYGSVQRRGTLDHLTRIARRAPARAARRARARGAAARAVRASVHRGRARPGGRGRCGRAGQGRGARGPRAGQRGAAARGARRRGAARRARRSHARSARASSTPIRSGSRGCGGSSSAPTVRAR